MTDRILSEFSPVYGFCPFDKISSSLIDCRAKSRIPENARSVIVLLFPYYLGDDAYEGSDISKYAVVPDYHDTLVSILKDASQKLKEAYPDDEFVVFADNSPIPEVKAATLAGLGVQGLNGLFINEDFGSWVFIGEIVTTKEYSYPEVSPSTVCIECRKCILSCPTKAIDENGVNPTQCLSYITQKKGELTPEQEAFIKESGCAWGCDVCQNVCPMNKGIKIQPLKSFREGAEIKARDTDISDRAYAWRGEKVIKRNLNLLK